METKKIQIKTVLTQEVIEKMMKRFGYKNINEVPSISKMVVGMSVVDALKDKNAIEKAAGQLALITGQKPATTIARQSISSFKLRKGAPVGIKVTIRGTRVFDFWTKLVTIVLPRMRDFKGVSPRGFDGQGNLNIGFHEQGIFPDLDYDKIDKTRGLEISIITTAKNNETAQALFEFLGMPFSLIDQHGKKK